MNLLMILLIILALWVCGAVCYFAWRVMSNAEEFEAPTAAVDREHAESSERDSKSDSL